MDGRRSRLYAALLDESIRTVLLFGVAAALGLGSVLLFVYSPADSPTRLHLGLILCSTALVLYLSLQSTPD
ncbi:hypothetical protein [Halorussus halobius]|uniref:hypothetical protein n=1 Tax=Halorussus halobius TaxID=1710537 RepID=UPI0010920D8A|nr:hypothetical protein [Halorussus halobius]